MPLPVVLSGEGKIKESSWLSSWSGFPEKEGRLFNFYTG
ncbi:hypothetical protein KKC1_21860 [Calderihabitans maritimus]|uniref:Uncharacterized protein n=1 Tax=Calderihabitans maritimus TaxID=1246530 RepID=A0A1Z5HUP4_9FIRM|nr:hypothetical protein KKC1_21860 [Calderihabitans maritimus]